MYLFFEIIQHVHVHVHVQHETEKLKKSTIIIIHTLYKKSTCYMHTYFNNINH